jgi:thiol-disulfide isomerase/thioredoxin
VVVGAFHGLLKEPPARTEVGKLSAAIVRATNWQGRYPADFSTRLLTGGEFHLADGLNFFATWCQPCSAEIPELLRFARAHRGEALSVLFVDAAEAADDVRRFAAEFAIEEPVALDAEKELGNRYGVDSYPTTVLIGEDGRIALYETSPIVNADVKRCAETVGRRTMFLHVRSAAATRSPSLPTPA